MTTENQEQETWESTKAELTAALAELDQVKAELTGKELTAAERDQLKQDLETLTIEVAQLRTELQEAKTLADQAEKLRAENAKLKKKAEAKPSESESPAQKRELSPQVQAPPKKKLQFL